MKDSPPLERLPVNNSTLQGVLHYPGLKTEMHKEGDEEL